MKPPFPRLSTFWTGALKPTLVSLILFLAALDLFLLLSIGSGCATTPQGIAREQAIYSPAVAHEVSYGNLYSRISASRSPRNGTAT
jgi:hypothetical protein